MAYTSLALIPYNTVCRVMSPMWGKDGESIPSLSSILSSRSSMVKLRARRSTTALNLSEYQLPQTLELHYSDS